MKLLVAAAAIGAALLMAPTGASAASFGSAAKAVSVEAGVTEAACGPKCKAYRRGLRRGSRRSGGTEVITTSPSGIDPTTLMLMLGAGGLTGGGNLGALALPLLLSQPQETTVIERRGRRRR